MAKLKDFKSILEDRFEGDLDKVLIGYGNPDEVITAIPTGSTALDASIGIGGIPRRRYTIIEGLEGLGKTTLAVSIAKQAIAMKEKVLYIDVENQMTFDYLDLLLGHGHIGEDFILTKPDTSDDAFVIAEAGIKSKEFALIILDSVGALAPEEEKAKKMEQDSMAIIPRDTARFLRRNSYDLRVNNVAFLFINQLRDKIGAYVPTYSAPGGHALKYYASVIISLTKGPKDFDIMENEEKVGALVPFSIKKNKVGMPFRSGTIPIISNVGVDSFKDIINFAKDLGVIRSAGPYYKFGDEVIGRGYEGTVEVLRNSPELLDKVKEMVYNIIVKTKPVESEEDDAENFEG